CVGIRLRQGPPRQGAPMAIRGGMRSLGRMRDQPHEGLELDEDLRIEELTHWTRQIVRWGLVALVAAGLLGVLGDGPLSGGTAISADGQLVVRYERVTRRTLTSAIRIDLAPRPGDEIEVRMPHDWLGAVS